MAVYEYNTRIRYSEIDSSGFLSPVALIDLFQNGSTFQSEDMGLGVDFLFENKRAWVLTCWQICINRLPKIGEHVTIRTWSYGIKLSLGSRNFELVDSNGERLAYANSLWAYVDTESGALVRVPQDIVEAYGKSPQIEMKCAPRKIELPNDMEKKDDFEVKYYFIDTNNHMNNEKYVLAAMEYIPEGFVIGEIRAEYKSPALLHDIVTPMVKVDDNTVTVALYDKDGNKYAAIQFLGKE